MEAPTTQPKQRVSWTSPLARPTHMDDILARTGSRDRAQPIAAAHRSGLRSGANR